MAIEIVKRGRDTFHADCNNCGTEFTYELRDLLGRSTYGGGWVCCPSCNTSYSHPSQARHWCKP